MRAHHLAVAPPVVGLSDPVAEAATIIADRAVPGLVVSDDDGRPYLSALMQRLLHP